MSSTANQFFDLIQTINTEEHVGIIYDQYQPLMVKDIKIIHPELTMFVHFFEDKSYIVITAEGGYAMSPEEDGFDEHLKAIVALVEDPATKVQRRLTANEK